MKRAIAATAITLSVIGGAAIVGRLDRTVPATTIAAITTHVQPVTGACAIPPPPIKEAEKENAWTANANVNATAGVSPRPTIPTTNSAKAVSGAITATTTGKIGSPDSVARSTETATSSATDDPYHDTMLPGGSKWATPISTAPANVHIASAQTMFHSTAASAATASTVSTSSSTILTTTDAPPQPPIPARPPAPDWTRCSTSWTQTLALGKSGEQIWTFSTTLSDADVQDLATAVRWYTDIVAKYPTVARNYAWLDCAGWRVRDYHQHASNVPPADYFGAQGLDSPLGICHSTTPFRRAGAGRCSQQSDELGCSAPGAMSTLGVLGGTVGGDGKVRGWVRWHGDWYVGTVEDATCTDQCVVGFDHPCDLSSETEQPARRWDVAGKMFYSWWWGGDVNGEPPW